MVTRYWSAWLLGWLLLVVALKNVAPRWDQVTQDGDTAYLPANSTSVIGETRLKEWFPNLHSKSQLVVVFERHDAPLTQANLEIARRIEADFLHSDHGIPISTIWTPFTFVIGAKLKSPDRHAALVVLHLNQDVMAVSNIRALEIVRDELTRISQAPDFPREIRLGVSGSAAIAGDMLLAARESLKHTELTSLFLVLITLLVVYRSVLLLVVPLVTIFVSVWVATDLLAILAHASQIGSLPLFSLKIFTTTRIFIVVVLFGSGTDFCLFLIARYRGELKSGAAPGQAVSLALKGVGDALLGSALTTVLGLAMLAFADFGKYSNSGPAIALSLLITLFAALTLSPALLQGLQQLVPARYLDGLSVFRRADREPQRNRTSQIWDRISRVVVYYPGRVLAVTLILMLPFALRGLKVDVTYDLLAELQSDRPSVAGTSMLRRHFSGGETSPINLIVHSPGADFSSREGARQVANLTKKIFDIEGVSSVRSLTEPLGGKPGIFNPFSPSSLRKMVSRNDKLTREMFLAKSHEGDASDVTRLDIVLKENAFSKESAAVASTIEEQLNQLKDQSGQPWHETSFYLSGTAVSTRDLQRVTTTDRTRIQGLVVIAVGAVLMWLLRRPMLSIYLVASVLFSYLVTIGATQWLFAFLDPAYQGLDWKVPLFLFVILVAVGMDYNIYLVTRILEEQAKSGFLVGLRSALVNTGGIITSCGVVMAGTFVSMMTSSLTGMVQLGFALSFGILLDTLVIRTILVPAAILLWGRSPQELEWLKVDPYVKSPTAPLPHVSEV